MSEGIKIIKIAASAVIVCTVLGALFFIYHFAQSNYKGSAEQEDVLYADIDTVGTWRQLVGSSIDGSTVRQLIVEDEFDFKVILRSGKTVTNDNVNSLTAELRDSSSSFFLNPVAKFKVSAIYSGEIIIGLQFKEVMI